MKLTCIAIDDEPGALRIVEIYVSKVPFLDLAGTFRNCFDALDFVIHTPVDLIFLDINMPDLSGIQFLKSITTPPMVIFTTAYAEFAVESYEYDAVDYLLKPFEFDRLLKAANKALSYYDTHKKLHHHARGLSEDANKDAKTVFIRSGQDIFQVVIDDILYIESAGNYVICKTKRKEIMTLMTMNDVLDILPNDQFIRVHRSYVVAKKHIQKVERHQLHIVDKKIPIGGYYRQNFFKFIEGK